MEFKNAMLILLQVIDDFHLPAGYAAAAPRSCSLILVFCNSCSMLVSPTASVMMTKRRYELTGNASSAACLRVKGRAPGADMHTVPHGLPRSEEEECTSEARPG